MDYLFAAGELRRVLDVRKQRMVEEIERFDANRLQSATTEELTKYFYEKYMFEPLVVRRDDAVLDDPPEETQVQARGDFGGMFYPSPAMIPAVRYTLRVPFDGEPELFRYQASTYTPAGKPSGTVESDHLVLRATRPPTDPPEAVKAGFLTQLEDVINHVGWANQDLRNWLPELRRTAWEQIEARKQRLSAAQNVAAKMGFKLRERRDVPKLLAAPAIRQKVRPTPAPQPPGSAAPYKSEPTLSDADYEHILSLISSMATVLERSPHAFVTMDEESLRFLLLVPLNSHYEGDATGEAFNFEGKTDILIRVKDRTIFIAECKIWGGKKELLAAIDQLLGYLTWRDTKTAIVIFNRNKDFSGVLAQIHPVVESHPKFKRFEKQLSETAFRFAFKQRDDEARELTLTVLLFNVPLPAPTQQPELATEK